MLRESETTPNGLYLIKGKFYGNPQDSKHIVSAWFLP